MPSPITLLSIFPSFQVGGAQVRYADLANHFGTAIRHVIVSMDGGDGARKLLSDGLDVRFVAVAAPKGDTLGNSRRYRKLLRDIRPDVLVTHNWGSIEWGMANWPLMTRHVHIEDGFGPEEARRQLWRRAVTRRLVLSHSTLVVPSRTLERIALQIWKLDPKRIRLVPNGIDCARFSQASMAAPQGEGAVLGTVAVLRQEKNIPRLLEAFAEVRGRIACRLVIAGDGPLRREMEAQAVRMGIAADVTFTGYVSDTERIYAALDVFALSSDTEQFPTSVLEAMAAGLAVAATDVGDVREMVSDENRPFVTAAHSGALAEAIFRLLESRPLRRAIGEANRNKALAQFDRREMFRAYAALFQLAGYQG